MAALRQIITVALFNLRSIPDRLGSACTAAIGIAGVVGVLVGVLAIAQGFRATLVNTAPPEVAIVLREGAENEMASGINRDLTRVIADAPGIARNANGPIASAELFVIINLPKRGAGTDANVPLRGVQPTAYDVRGNIKMEQGRHFQPGKNEIIVGTGAARSFAGLNLGDEIKTGQVSWTVVGIFSAAGGVAESEIWADGEVLAPAYNRSEAFQSVAVRLESKDRFQEFEDALSADPRLTVKTLLQADFYAEQSKMMFQFITTIGFFIASLMAIGALFGALNTMYSAVASRTREISTLRALGFGRGPVVVSILVESIVLSFLGGAVGALVAYLLFDGYRASTMNVSSFSQVTFAFKVTPVLLVTAIIFATFIGLVGGILPAIRAARLPIASGLRES